MDAFCIASGYLVGCINPAYIISRIQGYDIRDKGTGNAGATNIGLQSGIGYGIVALALDILKAFLATILPGKLGRSAVVAAFTGIACIVGHIFPFWLGFRGGKGTACVIGFGLALKPLLILPVTVLAMLLSKPIGATTFAPVFAAIIMAVYYAVFEGTVPMCLLMIALALILLIPRRQELLHIRKNKQNRDPSLWVSPLKLKEEYKKRANKQVK